MGRKRFEEQKSNVYGKRLGVNSEANPAAYGSLRIGNDIHAYSNAFERNQSTNLFPAGGGFRTIQFSYLQYFRPMGFGIAREFFDFEVASAYNMASYRNSRASATAEITAGDLALYGLGTTLLLANYYQAMALLEIHRSSKHRIPELSSRVAQFFTPEVLRALSLLGELIAGHPCPPNLHKLINWIHTPKFQKDAPNVSAVMFGLPVCYDNNPIGVAASMIAVVETLYSNQNFQRTCGKIANLFPEWVISEPMKHDGSIPYDSVWMDGWRNSMTASSDTIYPSATALNESVGLLYSTRNPDVISSTLLTIGIGPAFEAENEPHGFWHYNSQSNVSTFTGTWSANTGEAVNDDGPVGAASCGKIFGRFGINVQPGNYYVRRSVQDLYIDWVDCMRWMWHIDDVSTRTR